MNLKNGIAKIASFILATKASKIVFELLPWNLIVGVDHDTNKSLEGSYVRESTEPIWTQLNGENFIWAEKQWITTGYKWMIGSSRSDKIFCSINEATAEGPGMSTKWEYFNTPGERKSYIDVKPGKQ